MHSSLTIIVAGALCLTMLPAVGCRATEDTEQQIIRGPLSPDPTEHVALHGWWSNGQQLLRLDADGQYMLYGTPARLEPPQHRGRWLQPTYGHITLEPYAELDTESLSVQIVQRNGDVVLRVPGYDEFSRIDSPQPRPQRERSEPYEDDLHPPQPLSNTA